MKTQRVEHSGPRIETGPLKIGDDWTGIFIRGDEAIGIASTLKLIIASGLLTEISNRCLDQIADDLMACRENDK
jgi:hypothetical protein